MIQNGAACSIHLTLLHLMHQREECDACSQLLLYSFADSVNELLNNSDSYNNFLLVCQSLALYRVVVAIFHLMGTRGIF